MSNQALSLASMMDPAILANPYPIYAQLMQHAPILRDASGVWVVSRYQDVMTVLTDTSAFSSRRFEQLLALRPDGNDATVRELFQTVARQVVFLDPPEHSRLRGIMTRAFTPSRVEQMRSLIARFIDELINPILPRKQMDVIADFAGPLPAKVLCELLNIPFSDWPQIKQWSEDYVQYLSGMLTASTDQMMASARSMAAYMRYTRDIVVQRREKPGNDLVSALVQDDQNPADTIDLAATCVFLFTAGHETTTSLIANGLVALLANPEQRKRLSEPGLMTSAIDELLRYDAPVQVQARTVKEDTQLSGQQMRRGEVVYLILGAANRDPQRFAAPDALDVGRANNRHLSFGAGPHYCAGAALARAEAEHAFATMFERLPNLRVTGEVVYRPHPIVRCPQSLVVAWD
jgi:cytochrome P450